jgi:hypothetical protein
LFKILWREFLDQIFVLASKKWKTSMRWFFEAGMCLFLIVILLGGARTIVKARRATRALKDSPVGCEHRSRREAGAAALSLSLLQKSSPTDARASRPLANSGAFLRKKSACQAAWGNK